jgi:hypothetical protein
VASDRHYNSGVTVTVLAMTDFAQAGSRIWKIRTADGHEGYGLFALNTGLVRTSCSDASLDALQMDPTPLGSAPHPLTTPARPGAARNLIPSAAPMSTQTKVLGALALLTAGVAAWKYRRQLKRAVRG